MREYKAVKQPLTGTTEEDGSHIIEGYASVFGNVDLSGDVVMPGAFKETISLHGPEGGNFVKLFYWHQWMIGPMLELREDKRGLYFKGRILPTEMGRECWTHIQGGSLLHNSFAYDVLEELDTKIEDPAEYGMPLNGTRYLKKLRIYEAGPVPWPMNEEADLTAAKGQLASHASAADRYLMDRLLSELEEKDRAIFHLERELRSLTRSALRLVGPTIPRSHLRSRG